MQLLTGTRRVSYKEWLGHFYLGEAARELRCCATTPSVSSDGRDQPTPSTAAAEAMLARWSRKCPKFRFYLMRRRRCITHDKRLREAETDVAEFVRARRRAGEQAGVLLFQLPPFLKKDLPRLARFSACCRPASARASVRNASWQDRRGVRGASRARAAMLCVTDNAKRYAVCLLLRMRYIRLREPTTTTRSARLGRAHCGAAPGSRLRLFSCTKTRLGHAVCPAPHELWHALAGAH